MSDTLTKARKMIPLFLPFLDRRSVPTIEAMSPRERDVLELIVARKTTKQIAARLLVSPGTVRKHKSRLLKKFCAENGEELARRIGSSRRLAADRARKRRGPNPLAYFWRLVARLLLRPRRGLAGAQQLFRMGYTDPASMMARVAFERHARWLCWAHHCQTEHHSIGPNEMIYMLRRHDAIGPETATKMRRAMRTANDVAHGRHREVGEIADLIQGVDDFCRRHPVATN